MFDVHLIDRLNHDLTQILLSMKTMGENGNVNAVLRLDSQCKTTYKNILKIYKRLLALHDLNFHLINISISKLIAICGLISQHEQLFCLIILDQDFQPSSTCMKEHFNFLHETLLKLFTKTV